jgi:peptide/nickel transport system substrate-binding protein
MSRKSILFALSLLVIASMLLVSCQQQATPQVVEVEKTVVVTQEVIVEGETQIQEVVVTATPPPPPPAEPRTLVICMGQQPETLYAYGNSMLAMSHVLEAIYDGPIDGRTFDYQPIILEKLPSLADGDALLNTVTVKAGDKVVDNDGNPADLAAGIFVRPAGCNAADCAIEYDGTSDLEMEQMVVTFKLLPNLVWSDGTPLTAKDSVYSFNLAADPDTTVGKYVIERSASYEATDDVTIVWTGLPGYKDSTYFVNFYTPYPEHLWGQYTAAELLTEVDAQSMWVGWGPYVIDEWIKGDRITLSKNPLYFRASEGLPVFDTLVYRIAGENSNANIAGILAGECDIVDQTSGLEDQSELLLELQAAGQLDATFVTGTTWEHADFNILPVESYRNSGGFAGWDEDGDGYGPFGDVRLRQAVAMCMDRQAVVDTVLFGQSIVLGTYIPPNHPLYNPDSKIYPFDPAMAGALLDEIGWVDDDGDPATPRVAQGVTGVPDGTLLEFFYETTSATQRQQATQVMAESMAQCGMKVNLNYYPASEWFADGPDGKLFGRKFDLGQFAWLTGVQPACDLYISDAIPGDPTAVDENGKALYPFGWGGQNETGYSNPEYDIVCKAALQALPGQPAYEENHLAAQLIFSNDLPVVPLYLRLKLAATRPDMCNFFMDPTANSEMWNIEAFDYGECDQ